MASVRAERALVTVRTWGACVLARIALPAVVRAHDGAHHEERAHALAPNASAWNLDPWLLGALVLATTFYGLGARRLHRKAQPRKARRYAGLRREDLCFGAGMLAVVVALASPLDRLSDILFSAHMSQHELLMLVAAPLLVMARPFQAYLAALPAAPREAVARRLRAPAAVRCWRALTWPFAALGLHALVRWIWHAPPLFEAALHDEWIHGFQHATFFFTAALFWWALIEGRYGRMGYGVAVLFVFATALHTGALGALLTFARHTWYPVHAERTRALAGDALEDQQLAGLIMWVPAGTLFLAIGLGLFAAWLGELERRARRAVL